MPAPQLLASTAMGTLSLKLKFPNIQIVGLTATTPLTPLNLNYTVLRTEVAGFFGDPFFIEKQNFRLGVPIPKRDVIRACDWP